jgi:hypothetical protein
LSFDCPCFSSVCMHFYVISFCATIFISLVTVLTDSVPLDISFIVKLVLLNDG